MKGWDGAAVAARFLEGVKSLVDSAFGRVARPARKLRENAEALRDGVEQTQSRDFARSGGVESARGNQSAPQVGDAGGGPAWWRTLAVESRTDSGVVDASVVRQFSERAPRLRVDGSVGLSEEMGRSEEFHRFVAGATHTDGATVQVLRGEDSISEAPVFLVRDPDGHPLAIAKIFPRAEDLVGELSAMERFGRPEFQHFSVPDVLDIAALQWQNQEKGVMVMSLAQGRSLMGMMEEVGATKDPQVKERLFAALEESAGHFGAALGELHSVPDGSGLPVSSEWLDSEVSRLKDRTADLTGNERCREALRSIGVDPDELARRSDQTMENLRVNPGYTGLVHGDPHAENAFSTPEGHITFIDFDTAHSTMDRWGKPRGSPGLDVMRGIQETFPSQARRAGLSDQQADRLVTRIDTAYRDAGGSEVPAPAQAAYTTYLRTTSTWWVAEAWHEASEVDRPYWARQLAGEVAALKQPMGWA